MDEYTLVDPVRIGGPQTCDWLDVRVKRKSHEAYGICSVELVTKDGGPLPSFEAGAHIDLDLGGGIVRQYSLCNNPAETHRYVIAVLREASSRGGSVAVHDALSIDHVLRVSQPRNHFRLTETGGRSLLFAGGIGVTPLLAMAERLHTLNTDFTLHYCARSPDRMAFLDRLRSSPFANRVRTYFDSDPAEQHLDPSLALAASEPTDHLYVCGPGGFIDWVLSQARCAGWSEAQLRREYFTPPSVVAASLDAFDIQLARSRTTLHVPADKSIADVLITHGIDVPMSCEQGVCGTCLTQVLQGLPDHRDFVMTDAEHETNTQMTVCISRSKSSLLVLDL